LEKRKEIKNQKQEKKQREAVEIAVTKKNRRKLCRNAIIDPIWLLSTGKAKRMNVLYSQTSLPQLNRLVKKQENCKIREPSSLSLAPLTTPLLSLLSHFGVVFSAEKMSENKVPFSYLISFCPCLLTLLFFMVGPTRQAQVGRRRSAKRKETANERDRNGFSSLLYFVLFTL
jgi:hypothetical protein